MTDSDAGVVQRRRPLTPEHRANISAGMKRYANRPDAHQKRQPTGAAAARYKDGGSPRYYRKVCFTAHGKVCQRCGKRATLAHHINGDRSDNRAENLEPLCNKCHSIAHLGKSVDWTCPVCGTVIQLIPYYAAKRRYCSRTCKEASRGSHGRFT